jgi:hypothetical protein
MPVAINRIQKLGTPRLDLNPGAYPAHIVGMVYPKEANGECRRTFGESLLQVHKGDGVCYVATRPFDVSINEESPLCELLCGLTGAKDSDALYKWLEKNDYFNDGIFDECDFIGVPVMAQVERFTRRNDPTNTYNIVTGFAPIPESSEPKLNTTRLIPYGFARPNKYEIVKLDELDIDDA